MLDVVALGELLIDFGTVSTDEAGYPTLAARPGGAPANFLAALTKYGARTALVAKVGEDTFGHLLVETLAKTGIETAGVVRDRTVFTTLAFVTWDGSGERQFSFARKPGADTCLTWQEVDTALIDQARVFHFGTLSLTDDPAREATRNAVAYARERGKTITFDPNLRLPLWGEEARARQEMLWGLSQADVVKISDEEVDFLFGCKAEEGARRLLGDYGVKLAFVTCGKAGAWFINPMAQGFVDAPRGIQAVDTTGAGDIFGGSAVSRLLAIHTPPEKLTAEQLQAVTTFACAVASLSTTRPGGISSVPDLEEVMDCLGWK